jgi:hypothetical protein
MGGPRSKSRVAVQSRERVAGAPQERAEGASFRPGLGRALTMPIVPIALAGRRAAASAVHPADVPASNRWRSARIPGPLRSRVAAFRLVHVPVHGVDAPFFLHPLPGGVCELIARRRYARDPEKLRRMAEGACGEALKRNSHRLSWDRDPAVQPLWGVAALRGTKPSRRWGGLSISNFDG